MCRLAFISGESVKELKTLALWLTKNAVQLGNVDGYTFIAPKVTIRELYLEDYIARVLKLQPEKPMALIHARLGTSGRDPWLGIHGWEFQIGKHYWYCAHNGYIVEYLRNRATDYPDSYYFFQYLSETVESIAEDLPRAILNAHFTPFGQFQMVRKDFKYLVVIDLEWQSYEFIAKVDGKEFIGIASANDWLRSTRGFRIYSYEEQIISAWSKYKQKEVDKLKARVLFESKAKIRIYHRKIGKNFIAIYKLPELKLVRRLKI